MSVVNLSNFSFFLLVLVHKGYVRTNSILATALLFRASYNFQGLAPKITLVLFAFSLMET